MNAKGETEAEQIKQAGKLDAGILRLAAMAVNEKATKAAEKIAQEEFENLMYRAKLRAELGKFEMECYFIEKERLQFKCKEIGEYTPQELVHEILYDKFLRVGFTIETQKSPTFTTVTIRWSRMEESV